MMLPIKHRQRQVEEILFRNASLSPKYFHLKIKTDNLDLLSVVTVEPSIVSNTVLIFCYRIHVFHKLWTAVFGSNLEM